MSGIEKILARINNEELKDLILRLGNIPSTWGREDEVCEYIYRWMTENNFSPYKVGLSSNRFNVVAVVKGSGRGTDLIFNAHMDTAKSPHDILKLKKPNDPFYTTSWIDDNDMLYGEGVQNDKGPLACTLIAAKALKESKIRLKGDLIVTAVCGELGQEPIDEFQGLDYVGKDIGAHWLMTHGGIFADYALVAECTNFSMVKVQAGKAFFKVKICGTMAYTPFLKRPDTLEENDGTFICAARFIQAFELWAKEYEKKYTYHCSGGTVVPKAQIGAIRGGYPYYVTNGSEICYMYIDVRIIPGQDPREIRASLQKILSDLKLEGNIEMFLFRQGYEAKEIIGLAEAVERAHFSEQKIPIEISDPVFSSMWRDMNVFNEFGIPSLSYGPPRCPIKMKDMLSASKIYARLALDICS